MSEDGGVIRFNPGEVYLYQDSGIMHRYDGTCHEHCVAQPYEDSEIKRTDDRRSVLLAAAAVCEVRGMQHLADKLDQLAKEEHGPEQEGALSDTPQGDEPLDDGQRSA